MLAVEAAAAEEEEEEVVVSNLINLYFHAKRPLLDLKLILNSALVSLYLALFHSAVFDLNFRA